jgi:anti-anti-sigma regulatory factor
MRNLREQNRQLRIVGLNAEVRSIFEITRLFRVFDLADSVEKAIQNMRATGKDSS